MKFKNLVPQHILGTLSQESNMGVEPSIMGSSTPQSTKPNLYAPAEKLLELNTYINYYKATEMQTADYLPFIISQLPSDLLMRVSYSSELVEYATAGIDNHLFVSKYLLELPKKEQLEAFINNELLKWNS
jgi:hypothetical protein